MGFSRPIFINVDLFNSIDYFKRLRSDLQPPAGDIFEPKPSDVGPLVVELNGSLEVTCRPSMGLPAPTLRLEPLRINYWLIDLLK